MILVLAVLVAGAGQAVAPEAPPVVHAQRLDEVGRAQIGTAPRLIVGHRTLPGGSFAEVTALDSGRTIVVAVAPDRTLPPGIIAALSPAAATALGFAGGTVPLVRIRPAAPSPMEQAAIRGGTVVTRLDAPSPLLAALRRRLPQPSKAAPLPVVAPEPAPRPLSRPSAQPVAQPRAIRPAGRWFVQVAALSDAARAGQLAKSVDGVVRSTGRLYRVQAGPFATRAAAETARASLARRGFGDARITAQD